MQEIAGLDPLVIALLLVVWIIEMALLVWAILDWARRSPEAIRGNRWVWLAVILLLNGIGPIVYLAAGRAPKPAVDPLAGESPAPANGRVDTALDSLYGGAGTDAATSPGEVDRQ